MWNAIKGILGSKKWIGAIVAILVVLSDKIGIDLSPEKITLIVGALSAAIIGQGFCGQRQGS